MATGAFFNAIGVRFYVKAGTTASVAPTSSSGMTEVLSLTNAGIQNQSQTQEVFDYGSSFGYSAAVVLNQSYSIPMTMNLDLRDAGYQVLRTAALNAATGVTVEWYREMPEMTAAGDPQKDSGVAFVTDFSEQIEAGNVAQVSFTLSGYGAPTTVYETDA